MDRSEATEAQRTKLVREFLKSENTLSLATVSEDGSPRVCSLFYIVGGAFGLYWFSADASEHSRDLAHSDEVSIAVHHATSRWREICGVQMHGKVQVVLDPSLRKRVSEAYATRFNLGRILRHGLSQSTLYEFSASWVRYIDNSKYFGYKFEMTVKE